MNANAETAEAERLRLAHPRARTADNLNPKQEAFAIAFIETGDMSEAFRRAYQPQRARPQTINRMAYRVANHPGVMARIAQERDRMRARARVTLDGLTLKLDADRDLAREIRKPSAAIAALRLQAELHGLISSQRDSPLAIIEGLGAFVAHLDALAERRAERIATAGNPYTGDAYTGNPYTVDTHSEDPYSTLLPHDHATDTVPMIIRAHDHATGHASDAAHDAAHDHATDVPDGGEVSDRSEAASR